MMNCRAGSIVLTILIIMSALVIIIHSALRTSSYLLLLAHEREQSEPKMPKADK